MCIIVGEVRDVHDYIQIVFSDGAGLSIFNNYHYDDSSVLNIKGKIVSAIEESDSTFVIYFESGKSLSVGLTDDDYYGPEAMALYQEDKPTIVWNGN